MEHWNVGMMERWASNSTSNLIIPLLHQSIIPSMLLLEPREHLLSIPVKNLFFLFRRQPRNAFDVWPHVIVPFTGSGIRLRTRSRALRAKHTASRSDDSEEELQRLHVIERRVEIQLLQPLIEVLRIVGTPELRAPPTDLVWDGATAVRDNEL